MNGVVQVATKNKCTHCRSLYTRDQVSIYFDYAEKLYAAWPTPTCIISDGPYGVNGYSSHSLNQLSTQLTIATITGNTFEKASRIPASRFEKESGLTRPNPTRFWIDRILTAAGILAGWRARE